MAADLDAVSRQCVPVLIGALQLSAAQAKLGIDIFAAASRSGPVNVVLVRSSSPVTTRASPLSPARQHDLMESTDAVA